MLLQIASCVVVDCGDPGILSNGNTVGTTTTFNSVVNHTCNMGYALNGTNQRVCLESGNWSAPLPMCISKSDLLTTMQKYIYESLYRN